jgi:hypothetical protein
MPLDARVVEAMKEAFQGCFCHVCSAPAGRLYDKRFWCCGCYNERYNPTPPVTVQSGIDHFSQFDQGRKR